MDGTSKVKSKPIGAPPPYQESAPPMQPPGPQGHTVVITTRPTVMQPMTMQPTIGPKPSPVTCPSCNEVVMTQVRLQSTVKTHIMAVLLCLIFWPCVCVPYCVESCNDINHYCPNCGAYIGKYQS